MIFSGWKRSPTWRAKRRITAIGMLAPRYQVGSADFAARLRLVFISSFYTGRGSVGYKPGAWRRSGATFGKTGSRRATEVAWSAYVPEMATKRTGNATLGR